MPDQPLLFLQEAFAGNPPSVRSWLCLNTRHQRAGCTRCVDACPTDAIVLDAQRPALQMDRCVHCGACVPVCPTDVFTQPNPAETTLALSLAQLPASAPLELICPQHPATGETPAPVAATVRQRRCLAALSAEHLLELSGNGARSLWLDDSICQNCPIGQLQATIARSVATASGLLAACGLLQALALHSTDTDRLLAEPVQRPVLDGMQPKLSRRGFFGALRQMAQDRIEQAQQEEPAPMLRPAAPVDQRLPQQLPESRKRLLARLAQLSLADKDAAAMAGRAISLEKLPFARVEVDKEACAGCGLCVRFCPTGALHFSGDALGLRRPGDAPQPFALSFRASLCIDCGLCVTACPEDAIAFRDELSVSALLAAEWDLLVEGELVACGECGAPTAARPDDKPRCHVCRQRVEQEADWSTVPALQTVVFAPPVDRAPTKT